MPDLTTNFPNHFRHFYFSPFKGIILVLFSFIPLFYVQRNWSLCSNFKYVIGYNNLISCAIHNIMVLVAQLLGCD